MESALIIYCQVPKYIKNIRKKYDEHEMPAHITLGYLVDDYDEKNLVSILSKIKSFELKIDKIEVEDDIVYLSFNNQKKIKQLINKISKYIKKLPKSEFHMTVAYKRGHQAINIPKSVISTVKSQLPINVKIRKTWIVKRNKTIGKDWFRSKTIYLQ